MENRRYVILLLGLLVLAGLAPAASAYDNVGMHRAVNTMALAWFPTDVKQYDRTLDNAQLNFFMPVYGYAWDIQDGKDTKKTTYDYSQMFSVYRSKWMGTWIVDGGFSADEPELPMGIRHFYDPVHTPRFLNGPGYTGAPAMDAIDWVLTSNENKYSFYNGKIYFTNALASTDPESKGYYGCAWRSVGETMHVITDLCCPAHVRNDGHAISEPLEAVTDAYTVLTCGGGKRANLDYSCTAGDQSLRNVMENVAGWTNGHFFSGDSIGNAAGTLYYPQPKTTRGPDSDGNCYMKYDDGQERLAFRRSLTTIFGLTKESFIIEGDALVAQQERLVPTAIRASEAVLDTFLPRFEAKVDSVIEKSGTSVPTYTVTAHIDHIRTKEWPAGSFPSIRNGAHVWITNDVIGKSKVIPLSVSGSNTLNQFSADIAGEILPGDQVTVYYDFGGYRIYSDPVTVTSLPAATQKPTAAPTPAPTYTEAPDLIWAASELAGKIGGDMDAINIIYYSKYVFADSQAGDVPVSGRIIVDTDGIFGAPLEYEWAKTFQRNTQYKPDTMGVIKALYLTIPRTAAPGTYTWSITVTDNYGHICTKLMKVTIGR